jgi:DNA-binding PadR family transcriptional regulator
VCLADYTHPEYTCEKSTRDGGIGVEDGTKGTTRRQPITDLAFGILLALVGRELHGYALIKELRRQSGRAGLRTGTVYAALSRLQDDALVREVDPPEDDDDPRRRYYTVTELGRSTARAEAERLDELLALARDKRILAGRT